MAHLIQSHQGLFWSFGLSFAVIARVWLAQHVLMRPVIASSPGIVVWLILWTVAIVFLPFPTALLSDGGHQAITKVLYIGTLTASSLCLAVLALVIRRDPSLHEPGRDTIRRPPASSPRCCSCCALALSLVFPVLSYYPLILLVTGDWLTALWTRLRQP